MDKIIKKVGFNTLKKQVGYLGQPIHIGLVCLVSKILFPIFHFLMKFYQMVFFIY